MNRDEIIEALREPPPTCPKCGAVLDVDRSRLLTSHPPKYNAACKTCEWRGYVEALS